MNRGKFILLIFLFCFLLTGCASNNIDITINSKDRVVLTQTILVNNEDFDTLLPLIKNDSDSFMYGEYAVEKIIGKEQSGYKMYKDLGKLYKLDQNNKESIELTKYASDTFDDEKLFDYKKRPFSFKYTGRFTIDLTDLEKTNNDLPILGSFSSSIDGRETSIYTTDIISDLNKNVTSTFTLNTKYKITNSNATSKKGDTYTWNLKYGVVNEIYFEMIKDNNGSILTIIVLLVIGAAVYLFIEYRKELLRAYARVTIKDSLDLEYRKNKRADIIDIRLKNKHKEKDYRAIAEKEEISNRIHSGMSLGAYTNVKTIDELSEDMDEKYKSIKPKKYDEIDDPSFKMVGKQLEIQKEKEKEKKESEVFIPKDKQKHND